MLARTAFPCLMGCILLLDRGWSLADDPTGPTVTSGGLRFEERLVWGDGQYVFGITATDIDGDGDLDLSTAGVHSDMLVWHENDGQGNLQQHLIGDNDPGYLERHAFGDLDADGDLDVVIVKNKIGHLIWFENNGTPQDGQEWARHVISTDFMRAYDVGLTDIDGDGRLDIAASAYTGDCFSWFPNPGHEKVREEWTQYRFDSSPEIANTRMVIPADINRDGRPDLVATGTYGNRTLWYENTGLDGVERFRRHLIDDQILAPAHGQPVDLDDDGDLDVIVGCGMRGDPKSANSNQVCWYENVGAPGRGTGWTRHKVGDLKYCLEAVTGDLDSDGDLDVVASGCDGGQPGVGEVCWFENTGDPQQGWRKHQLKSYPRAAAVIVMDLDADGRLDVGMTSEAGTCYWYRNLGLADAR